MITLGSPAIIREGFSDFVHFCLGKLTNNLVEAKWKDKQMTDKRFYLPCCKEFKLGESSEPFSTTWASSKKEKQAFHMQLWLPQQHSLQKTAPWFWLSVQKRVNITQKCRHKVLPTYLPLVHQRNHPDFWSSRLLSRLFPSSTVALPENTNRSITFPALMQQVPPVCTVPD